MASVSSIWRRTTQGAWLYGSMAVRQSLPRISPMPRTPARAAPCRHGAQTALWEIRPGLPCPAASVEALDNCDSVGQWASRSGHGVFGFDAKEAAHAQRRSDHAGRGVLGLQRGKGQGLLGQGSRALRGSKCDSSWMLARTCPSGRSSAPL